MNSIKLTKKNSVNNSESKEIKFKKLKKTSKIERLLFIVQMNTTHFHWNVFDYYWIQHRKISIEKTVTQKTKQKKHILRKDMASTSSTMANHSEIPPWKIELIQRKKKFGAISPNGSIQRTIMQFDSNDANSGKCSIKYTTQKKVNTKK